MLKIIIRSLLDVGRKRLPQERIDQLVGPPCLAADDLKDMWGVVGEREWHAHSRVLAYCSPILSGYIQVGSVMSPGSGCSRASQCDALLLILLQRIMLLP
jgi:hypothetical protein